MQILETTPTYYRVQLPSGQVLTIAKTEGTTQMLGAGGAAPNAGAQAGPSPVQGMADGGMVAPEFLPPPVDPLSEILGTVEAPLIYEGAPGMPAMPPVVGGVVGQNPKLDLLKKVAEPWMAPQGAGDVLFGIVPRFAA